MSKLQSRLNLRQVGRVCVTVADTDRAIDFYVDRLAGGSETGICLDTSDVDADHATLKAAGVDVDDEVARWGGPVPPMFWLRDPDGNSLIVVQPSE